jgi:hypothetical protein
MMSKELLTLLAGKALGATLHKMGSPLQKNAYFYRADGSVFRVTGDGNIEPFEPLSASNDALVLSALLNFQVSATVTGRVYIHHKLALVHTQFFDAGKAHLAVMIRYAVTEAAAKVFRSTQPVDTIAANI